MKIIGLRIEKYIGQNISGYNCNFQYHDEEMERYILCGILSDGKKVEITLSEEYGECCSGWTTASWGNIEIEEVERFNGYTHRPTKELIIDDINLNSDYISNEVFAVSEDGGDHYYPSGYFNVNMSLFKTMPRHKDKRPVWIFKGGSNLGKSFIASNLNGNVSVYETDMCDSLPEKIYDDVIVLGNKYTYKLDEIKNRIFGDCEIILVDFNKN